jgi:hypothetical protein
MRQVTLVSSVHRENGQCNSQELLEIFGELAPDVVFEELRPSAAEEK